VRETPLPHVSCPLLIPQLPLEDVIVKLEVVPDKLYVARVCVDQVAADRSPPMVDPEVLMAWMVALLGRLPGA